MYRSRSLISNLTYKRNQNAVVLAIILLWYKKVWVLLFKQATRIQGFCISIDLHEKLMYVKWVLRIDAEQVQDWQHKLKMPMKISLHLRYSSTSTAQPGIILNAGSLNMTKIVPKLQGDVMGDMTNTLHKIW